MRMILSLQISDLGRIVFFGTDEKELCLKQLLLKQGGEDRRALSVCCPNYVVVCRRCVRNFK